MPIYEYQCQDCGHKMEAMQKMNDPLLTDCPNCAAPQLKKLVSAGGFQLKGSGWYQSDFKNNTCQPEACGTSGCPAANQG